MPDAIGHAHPSKVSKGTSLAQLEPRLRRLQQTPEYNEDKPLGEIREALKSIRTDAAAASQQIEALGQEYNVLEERIYGLECKEDRLKELEVLLKSYEDHTGKAMAAVDHLKDYNSSLPRPKHKEVTPSPQPLFATQESLDALARRVKQLEQYPSPPPSIATPAPQSINELAQGLLLRLSNGEVLEHSIALRLNTATKWANKEPHVPKRTSATPSLTEASTTRTSLDSAGAIDDQPPRKRGPGRPKKTSLGNGSDDKPPTKHPGGCARTKRSLESNTTTDSEPPLKRPRGRPRAQSQGSRRPSGLSAVSSTEVQSEVRMSITQSTADDAAESVSTPPRRLYRKSTSSRPSTPRMEVTSHEANDIDQDDNINMEHSEQQDQSANIPPERRSGRTPKKTERFGNTLSWTDVDAVMQTLGERKP